jgi:hypothetical protein
MTTNGSRETTSVIDSIKAWLFPLLLAGIGAMVQINYASISADMKELKVKMEELAKSQAVNVRDFNYIEKKLNEHEKWLEQLDATIYKRK